MWINAYSGLRVTYVPESLLTWTKEEVEVIEYS